MKPEDRKGTFSFSDQMACNLVHDMTVGFSNDFTGYEKCILRGRKTQQQQSERLTRENYNVTEKPIPYIRLLPTIT